MEFIFGKELFVGLIFLFMVSATVASAQESHAFAATPTESRTLLNQEAQSDPDCRNALTSDRTYLEKMAENGSPDDEYRVGIYYERFRGMAQTLSNEAVSWFTKAAIRGNGKAQAKLCRNYTAKINYQQPAADEDERWCEISARHGDVSSLWQIGLVYQKGLGVKANQEESCFWLSLWQKLSEKYSILPAQVCQGLAPLELQSVQERVFDWKPDDASLATSPEDYFDPLNMPMNTAGLMCGGLSHECHVESVCGDFAAIECTGGEKPYLIASRRTKTIINSCSLRATGKCGDLFPKEWTCPIPTTIPPGNLKPRDVPPNNSPVCLAAVDSFAARTIIFYGLKRINLHVAFPQPNFDRLMKCHNREEECFSSDENPSVEADHMRSDYNALPRQIVVENLTKTLANSLGTVFGPIIKGGCVPLTIINDAGTGHCIDVTSPEEAVMCGKKTVSDYLNDVSNITFDTEVEIVDGSPGDDCKGNQDGRCREAIITLKAERKDCEAVDKEENFQVRIPLNLPNEEIEKRVNGFVDGLSQALREWQSGSGKQTFSCDFETKSH